MASLKQSLDSPQSLHSDHGVSLSFSPEVRCWLADAGLELDALGEGAPAIPVNPAHIVFSQQDELGVTAQKIAAVAFAGAGSVFPPLNSALPAHLQQSCCDTFPVDRLLGNLPRPLSTTFTPVHSVTTAT